MSGPPPSPFREADWRARRCRYLVEHNQLPCSRDDGWTRQGWHFYRELARAGDERQRERVRRRQPHLAATADLCEGDPFRRAELEARLLSREPLDSVAARFGLAASAVEAYAALHFDVLDSLDATYYVVQRVIGYSPARTFSEKDIDVWLKLFGYLGGTHALDVVVDYFCDPEPIPPDLSRVEPSRLARIKRHLAVRAALLARCVCDRDRRLFALDHLADRLKLERLDKLVDFEVPYEAEWIDSLVGYQAAQAAGG